MKKREYTKPLIRIEAFALSQSIAKACGIDPYDGTSMGKPKFADIDSCAWEYSEGGDPDDPFYDPDEPAVTYYFWLASPICDDPVSVDFEFGDYCYNNPNSGISVFASA